MVESIKTRLERLLARGVRVDLSSVFDRSGGEYHGKRVYWATIATIVDGAVCVRRCKALDWESAVRLAYQDLDKK